MINKGGIKELKYVIIDERMRTIEKEKLRNLGFEIIEIEKNDELYSEISSHVDISCLKINNNLIVNLYQFDIINEKLKNEINLFKGNSRLEKNYPNDIAYNVAIVGNNAIHNFKYTDKKALEILKREKFNLIQVNQGYTNCSIAIIDENSIITTDKGIYNSLKDYDFDILFMEDFLDIKLLNGNNYSIKTGFIGGAISRIENNIFITGDLNKIDKDNKIRKFIANKGLKIIEFEGIDVIDYGGIIYGL